MGRRLVVRLGFSLLICALVGLVLVVSADAGRWTGRDVKVLTTSARSVDGRLRSASFEGLELVVDDRPIAIPWRTVVLLSFR